MTILLIEVEEMLAPTMEDLDAMLIVASASIEGMMCLQTLGKFSMIFLS